MLIVFSRWVRKLVEIYCETLVVVIIYDQICTFCTFLTVWCSIATISTLPGIQGFPFTNVKSFVDGSLAVSTGIPYFYMAPADFTAKDLSVIFFA